MLAARAKLSGLCRTTRLLLTAAAVGGGAAATFLIALIARDFLHKRAPGLVLLAALFLGFVAACRRLAQWADPTLGALAVWLGAAGLAPLFVAGAHWAMSDPLVVSSWRCGTGEMTLLMMAPFGFFFWGFLSTTFAAGLVSGGREKKLRPVIHGVTATCLLGATVILLFAAIRAVKRPDVDVYIDSLPVTATFPPATESGPLADLPPEDGIKPRRTIPPSTRDNLTLYRSCSVESCEIGLGDGDPVAAGSVTRELYWFGPVDTPIHVRRDDAHGFVVLEGRSRVAFGEKYERFESVDIPRMLRPTKDVSVRLVADSASPPLGWIAGGTAGILLVFGLLALVLRRHQKLKDLLAGSTGMLGDNGWIHFEDGRPTARVSPTARIPSGPVLVRRKASGAGAYRESKELGAGDIAAGTRATHEEAFSAYAAQISAAALAITVLTSAPLIAAWTVGLLG